mgnify:CR=1 FL=1
MITKSTKFHNEIANKYEKGYKTPYWNLYHEISWEHIKKYLPKDKKYPILDAGGGTGYWSRKLAQLGFNVVCSDVAEKMLDAGRKIVKNTPLTEKIKFVVSDITDMKEFNNDSFSLVLAEGDPVGYCGDPQKAIKELARVARKGSAIIVSVDSLFSVMGRMVSDKKFKQLSRLLKTHIFVSSGGYPQYHFSAEELRELYSRNNISVDSIIGKTVFTRFIPRDKIDELLANKSFYKQILKLELEFNSEPSVIGYAGHIEIAGIKK